MNAGQPRQSPLVQLGGASRASERRRKLARKLWVTVAAASGCLLVNATASSGPFMPRRSAIFTQRLKWDAFVANNEHRDNFRRLLRMPLASFNRLVSLLHNRLQVHEGKASGRGGAILPEISVFCTLRFLAGASYLDVLYLTGISMQAFYNACNKTFDALVTNIDLTIKFPTSRQDCCATAAGFQGVSYDGIVNNCIGAIDGYLALLKVPAKEDVGNQKCFFSGHYKVTGMNIQAVCDHNCRFTFFALAAPGGANDRDAIRETTLHALLKQTPHGYVLLADAAYIPCSRIVPMFWGASKKVPELDNFNYFASQCRTRIEMAFGIMRQKWGILCRPLSVKLSNAKFVLLSIAILHNYVINERLRSCGVAHDPAELNVIAQQGLLYEPSQPMDEDGDPVFYLQDGYLDTNAILPGYSVTREMMVERVKDSGHCRPRT